MSQPAVKWGVLETYLKRNDFEIVTTRGGDKLIIKDGIVHRIGHIHCSRYGDEVPRGHVSAVCRKFGLKRSDIVKGKKGKR